jgi:hypothetical protein
MQKKLSATRVNRLATTAVALLMTTGVSFAQAQGEMDHGKMNHGSGAASAPTQWADPGKAQQSGVVDGKPAEAPAMDHSAHGGMMSGMDHHGGGMGGKMGGMDREGGHGGGMMRKMICGFADKLDGRLAFLKAELKLTEAQTATWTGFEAAWKAAAEKALAKCAAMDAHMDMEHGDSGVLGKLTMMETHMTDHLEVVRAQKAALEPLLKNLTDEQKKVANETLTGVMKVGGMGGGMGQGMGGGGMGGGMKHDRHH